MGGLLTKLFKRILNTDTKIVMVGLDAAGKTTIMYKLKLGEISTISTIGFNVEQTQYKNLSLSVWDVGGRSKIRPLWRHYMQDADAFIFVLDSNDKERIPEANEELKKLLADLDETVPILILANKQDLPNAMECDEITTQLGCKTWGNRKWYIQATCAPSGDGLIEGLDWLSNHVAKNQVYEGVSGWWGSSASQKQEETTTKPPELVAEKKLPPADPSQTTTQA